MTKTEIEYIKEFIKEHEFDTEFYIPPSYKFLSDVANTEYYLRAYFEWKGRQITHIKREGNGIQ